MNKLISTSVLTLLTATTMGCTEVATVQQAYDIAMDTSPTEISQIIECTSETTPIQTFLATEIAENTTISNLKSTKITQNEQSNLPPKSTENEQIVPTDTPQSSAYYTQEDVEILAIIIYQEHGGDASSDETRIKIGNVVMNRVKDPRFPDSVKEVALQPRQWGKLSKTGIVWSSRASNPSEIEAVKRAYDCAKRVLDGEKLLPANVVWSAEFRQGKGTYEYIDGTYFCY